MEQIGRNSLQSGELLKGEAGNVRLEVVPIRRASVSVSAFLLLVYVIALLDPIRFDPRRPP